MLVVKGFNKDLTCRGYQFKRGLNETAAANCAENGFHAAENPLDCLSYYPNMKSSVYWLCDARGDIHEDEKDSKVACTRLELLEELTLERFVEEALQYIALHPHQPLHSRVRHDRGYAADGLFTIVAGEHPVAAGPLGSVLGYYIRKGNKQGIVCRVVDGTKWLPGVYYDWLGTPEREEKTDG